MDRRITGFASDDAGEWVAELECQHRQHVRHQPPFRSAPWVTVDTERERRVGTGLDCPLCDRCELPDGLDVLRVTASWDESSMPPALRRAHRVAPGTWGRLRIEEGSLRFVARTDPVTDVVLSAGEVQGIPPDVDHRLEATVPVRFAIDFLGSVG